MGPFWQPICAVVDYRCSGAVQQSRPLRAVVAQFPDLGAGRRRTPCVKTVSRCGCSAASGGAEISAVPAQSLQVAPDRGLGLQAQPRGGGAVRP